MRDWQPILGLPLWFWLFIAPSLFALFCLYNRDIARQIITPVWRILDPIYKISGVIAASFLAIILCLIVGQMVSRWTGLCFRVAQNLQGMQWRAHHFLRWLIL